MNGNTSTLVWFLQRTYRVQTIIPIRSLRIPGLPLKLEKRIITRYGSILGIMYTRKPLLIPIMYDNRAGSWK